MACGFCKIRGLKKLCLISFAFFNFAAQLLCTFFNSNFQIVARLAKCFFRLLARRDVEMPNHSAKLFIE